MSGLTDIERKDLVKYKLERASMMIDDVEILLSANSPISAMNRLYYSCYYAAEAYLIFNGIIANTHAGVRNMFHFHLIKGGLLDRSYAKMYNELFLKRQDGDYGDFQYYTVDDVQEYLPQVKRFVQEITNLLQ